MDKHDNTSSIKLFYGSFGHIRLWLFCKNLFWYWLERDKEDEMIDVNFHVATVTIW